MLIKDILSDWLTDGLFEKIETMFPERFPWLGTDAGLVDLSYIGHSGKKTAGSIIDTLLEAADATQLDSTTLASLAAAIVKRFGANWDARYTALTIEYSPLENYNMTEEETPDITRQRTLDLMDTGGVTADYQRQTETATETDVTVTQNTDAAANRYGFNSTTPVPVDESNGNGSTHTVGDPTKNKTTATDTGAGGETLAKTGTDTETETGTRTLTRSGNIGTLTSQAMLESELHIRSYDFINSVFEDVDRMITVPIYDFERS